MPPAPPAAASLGDLYSKCVQMVNENKISTKNAWELNLIEHMDDIVDSFMGGRKAKSSASTGRKSTASASGGDVEENRFHEASCTIEASARIYACRVDCVHTDTYRVLGGLSSADMGDDDGKDGDDGKNPASKRRRICGVNTLEKNEASIIQTHLEADEQSDPTFRRMAAAFDAGGAKGLLLSHLPIAEDLSLVFNGDVPLTRAMAAAQPMWSDPATFPINELGLGDAGAAASRIVNANLCPEVDKFRKQFFGVHGAALKVALPDSIESLFGPMAEQKRKKEKKKAAEDAPPAAIADQGADVAFEAPAFDASPVDDGHSFSGGAFGGIPEPVGPPMAMGGSQLGDPSLPLTDMDGALVPLDKREDVIAFDALFEKFCGTGSKHQFAYFDDCWSKGGKEKGKDAKGRGQSSIADAAAPGAAEKEKEKEKAPKRPLFDLAAPPKPIETEPVAKHMLSERAAQWQLHKDVPPYMIDRITMPSWPTWSKCDFACLGLRPHLMLKLVRKSPPEGEGPHAHSDLFSTVVVENPEAFPWLTTEARGKMAANGMNTDDEGGFGGDMDFGGDMGDDDGFAGNGGLPAHLDVDPTDLFLRPDDKVLHAGADGDYSGSEEDYGAPGAENPFQSGIDFDMVDAPATVGNTDIQFSRNSKFVDVKLVKKHLWDCISDDIEEAKAAKVPATDSSFKGLVERTMRRLPKGETGNLSIAVCFICALHLCNEKGLELKVDPELAMGDFAVVGQSAAAK